jgi:heat shock protein HslJ
MVVHEEPKACQRMMPMTCMQVQKDGSKEWELFYDPIYGFEYEAGYRYEISVTQTERPAPVPADLSKYIYRLNEVISKKPALVSSEIANWKIVTLNGKTVDNENAYFGLDVEFKHFSGRAACNLFNGEVKFNKRKTKLTTGVFAATEMACDEPTMALEDELLKAISNRKFKLKMVGEKWVWSLKGKSVIEFIPQALTTQTEETGTEMVKEKTPWDYFSNKNMKVIQVNGETLKDSKAKLVFDKQANRFSGSNGCNQINGTFNAEGNTIEFTGIVSTKMMCTDENIQKTERAIMDNLRKSGLTVDFAEQVINIYDASGALILMLAVSDEK